MPAFLIRLPSLSLEDYSQLLVSLLGEARVLTGHRSSFKSGCKSPRAPSPHAVPPPALRPGPRRPVQPVPVPSGLRAAAGPRAGAGRPGVRELGQAPHGGDPRGTQRRQALLEETEAQLLRRNAENSGLTDPGGAGPAGAASKLRVVFLIDTWGLLLNKVVETNPAACSLPHRACAAPWPRLLGGLGGAVSAAAHAHFLGSRSGLMLSRPTTGPCSRRAGPPRNSSGGLTR